VTSRKEPNNLVTTAISVMAIVLAMVAAACSILGVASRPCLDAAEEWGPDFRVAASFATTVGRVRAEIPTSTGIIPAAESDTTSAFICYLDGEFPKGPPPVNGVIQTSYDRGIVVVVGEFQALVTAGYRRNVPIRDPNL